VLNFRDPLLFRKSFLSFDDTVNVLARSHENKDRQTAFFEYFTGGEGFCVVFILLSLRISAQTLDVTFTASEYKGGYNISCYGAADGRLEAIIIGGTPPYAFQWSNRAFTNRHNRADVMQHAIDRMMDQIYWASTYLERPWVLEETGFTSSDDPGSWDCGTFGNYSDLNAFMQDLLPIIRDCGPSGYAWWGFQDSFENGYTPPDCSLEVPPGQGNLEHSRRSWAFLMSGDPTRLGATIC